MYHCRDQRGSFMRQFFDKTTLKFLLVGIVNTVVGCGTMFLLYNLVHCSYWLSSAANYLIGSIVSYFLNKHYTFRNRTRSLKQVLLFAANTIVCWLISYALAKPFILWLLTRQSVALQENIAMVVGMVLYTGLNYLGQRFFVFR